MELHHGEDTPEESGKQRRTAAGKRFGIYLQTPGGGSEREMVYEGEKMQTIAWLDEWLEEPLNLAVVISPLFQTR